MGEVYPLAVDQGGELRDRIESLFLLPPIELSGPVLGELLQMATRNASAPTDPGQFAGPARPSEAELEVIERGFCDFDSERLHLCHRSLSLLDWTERG